MTTENGDKTLIGQKSDAEILREIQEAALAEKNKEMEAKLMASAANVEGEKIKRLSGRDLPFSAEAFIKTGVVRKENIRITDELFVDMETVTQKNRALAETLVKAKVGNAVEDRAYFTFLDTALLCISIIRINDQEFPTPAIDAPESEAKKKALTAKTELFNLLLNATQEMIQTLTVIYNGLENADVLIPGSESVVKK